MCKHVQHIYTFVLTCIYVLAYALIEFGYFAVALVSNPIPSSLH